MKGGYHMQQNNFLVNNVVASMDSKSKGTILRSMAIFTAIELCGSFLSGKTGSGTTKSNFLDFCKSKYMPKGYEILAELLYTIFRNGVAHSYIPKGAAILSSDTKGEDMHLKCCADGLFIYVPKLADDVTEAVKIFYNDLKCTPDLKSKYEAVISELDNAGKNKYNTYIRDNNITPEPCAINGDIITDIL